MAKAPIILWFRQDLRLADHRALTAAVESGAPVLPVYVLDDASPGRWAPGAASRWWLHNSLEALGRSLKKVGGALVLRRGDARHVIAQIAAEVGASAVYCSRCYEPWASRLEDALDQDLGKAGIAMKCFSGALLHDPTHLRTRAGAPYKVYSPFWRALSQSCEATAPLPAPKRLKLPAQLPPSEELSQWQLLPTQPDWSEGLRKAWKPGEDGATRQLAQFLNGRLERYAELRNRPDLEGTSRLSPHLHFGEVSVNACWHAASLYSDVDTTAVTGAATFLKELAWREFSNHLLVHWPDLPDAPFRKEFSVFPWQMDDGNLKAWQCGRTGYPIVDAGMRELWATGWMHNRARMITGSFLIKDLLIPWQAGEAWFWDTLVDADLANNAASWQWVAGSGADAAPYFRIFNPQSQGERFDPSGDYVRRWVPELAALSALDIHKPWTLAAGTREAASDKLSESYCGPIVDHGLARTRALDAYNILRRKTRQ